MTKLSNTARTILRSRIRRHPDVDRHVTPGGVSALTNADLVQIGLLLGLNMPSAAACAAYDQGRAAGFGRAAVLSSADDAERAAGTGGAGFDRIDWMGNGSNAAAADAAALDTETDAPDADDVDADAAPVQPEAEPEHVARAKARVQEVQGMMGRGDFVGFQSALLELATEAFKPAPVAAPARPVHIDLSRIKGHVPQQVGAMSMAEAKIPAGIAVTDAATSLPIYDAPDAPAVDPSFDWPDATGPMLAALRRGRNVFLWGPAGTGKTTLAQQIAAKWGRPFVRISCDDQTEAATLMGMTVPAKDGGTEWQDGQLTAAIRRPGTVILVDEPTIARPGALFVLQAVLDDNRALHIPDTGEVVPVAPDVLILLADNTNGTGDSTGQYEATRVLNRATLDRMALTIRLDYMTPEREARVLVERTGIARKSAAVLCKWAALTRTKADDGALSHGVGLRRLIALAECIADGVDPAAAMQMAVIETAPYDDREPLRQLWAAEIPTGALL